MKKLYAFILFAFAGTIANAQQRTFCVSINASLPSIYDNFGYSMIQSTDGGYVVAGYGFDDVGNGTGWDAYVAKLDSTGALLWKKSYGSSYQVADNFTTVIQTTDGGYIAAGQSENPTANTQMYVVKMDNTGNMQWQKTIGSGTVNSIIQTSDGGYACVGNSTGSGNNIAVIFRLDNTGATKWSKTIQQSGIGYTGNAIVQSKDKGIVITGSRGGLVLVAKFDSVGTKKWSYYIKDAVYNIDGVNSMLKSNDGGYIIFAAATYPNHSAYLVKIDSVGVWKWSKTIPMGHANSANNITSGSMTRTKDGGYVLVSGANGNIVPNSNIVVKLDSMFNVKWTKFVGSNNSWLPSIVQTKDAGYALAGGIPNSPSYYNIYAVKLDSMGNGCCSYGPFATTTNTATCTEVSDGGAGPFSSSVAATNITASIGTLSSACLPMALTTTVSSGCLNPPCHDTATVSINYGLWPYTYLWSNGQTTKTATGLCAGTTYTATITDASSATATVTATIPAALSTSMIVTNPTSCTSNNGKITANVSGGTAPYTYLWSNSKVTATITGLAPATFTLTVTDTHSCTNTFTATVSCTTDISNYDLQNEFSIYPNPSNGSFIFNSQLSKGELEIYNVMGEKVNSSLITNQSTYINIDVPNGIYFLQLKTEQGVATKKLVIQK